MNSNMLTRRIRFPRRRYRPSRFVKRTRNVVKRTMKHMSETKFVSVPINLLLAGVSEELPVIADIIPTIPQGPDKVNRIGNNIQYKFLTVRLGMSLRTNLSDLQMVPESCYFARVILYQKRVELTNGADVIGQYPTTSTLRLAGSTLFLPPFNQNVRVLNDEVIPLYNSISSGTGTDFSNNGTPSGVAFTWRHKIHNNVTFRSGTQNTPTDVSDQYGILVMLRPLGQANPADALNVQLAVAGAAKISYIDV